MLRELNSENFNFEAFQKRLGNLVVDDKSLTLGNIELDEKIVNENLKNFDDDVANEEKRIEEVENVKEKNESNDDDIFELDDGRTPEALRLIEELGLDEPGEGGEPVILPTNISDEIKQKIKEGDTKYGFNSFISSLISFNRQLPDQRNEICKSKVYDFQLLPKCSIIIIFHNEEWSVFMRTIHSILMRSPMHLIEEILLVDDASDRGE